MTRTRWHLTLLSLVFLVSSLGNAKVITINSTNNVSPGPGETNLIQAISLLSDGDAIHFNIPGPGPFYLVTPPISPDNGYPPITNNNVTIDGYSQPGSRPNSNPILSSNNADLKIVLDSRAGGARVEDIGGYSLEEAAVLFIKGASNVTIRGLCFLGPGFGSSTEGDPFRYAVSFALGAANNQVSGCRFGLDLDNQGVHPFQANVSGFRAGTSYVNGTTVGVEKNSGTTAAARAEFNLFLGGFIPVILEGDNSRISGNFFNVYPGGMTDFNIDGTNLYHQLESFIEIGRRCNNLVVGTDSDGTNDSDERNVFGGAFDASDAVLQLYAARNVTNVIFAGNYVGVAIDGQTRFTNALLFLDGPSAASTLRIGSDLDGFEDALEGNLISMNYPFEGLYSDPSSSVLPLFSATIGTLTPLPPAVSLRHNRLLGNNVAPVTFFSSNTGPDPAAANSFTNTYTAFMDTNNLVPSISPNSSTARLRGVCAVAKAPYTNVMIDVYVANTEGWNNGASTQVPDLSFLDPVTSTSGFYGYAQGETYLGTFLENGPQDLDPLPGSFEFDLSSLPIPPGAMLTFNANYSASPPGTSNAVTVSTIFANPITLQPALNVSPVANGMARLAWPSTAGAFQLQTSADLHGSSWIALDPQPMIWLEGTQYAVYVPCDAGTAYFRLARQ